jgi:hypothetical protein
MAFDVPFASLEIDKKNRVALEKQLKELGVERITAGIHKEQGAQMVGKNARLIDIAVQNEYGNEWTEPKTIRFQRNGEWFYIKKGTSIKIPATRFVGRLVQNTGYRAGLIDEIQASIHMMLAPYNGYDSKKETAQSVVRSIGRYMANTIKSFIDNKEFSNNAEMTIAAKGFDKRLYDTGTLYNSIKWRSKKQKGE